MLIRNRTTGAVITIGEFKSQHPRTDIAKMKSISSSVLDTHDYDPVLNGAQPSLSSPYETIVYDGVEQIDGQWFTKFVVGPIFTDNEEQTAEEQRTAYLAKVDADVGNVVRVDRDARLAVCDWTVLPDSPLTSEKKTEWQTYRQALRDIPASENFPHNVTWPTKPS